jgi:MFS family permease
MRGRYMAMMGLFFGIGGAAGSQIAFTIFELLVEKKYTWGIIGLVGFITLIGYVLLWKMTNRNKKIALIPKN